MSPRAVRAEVDFYKSTRAVTDDDLLASCADNLRIALNSLRRRRGLRHLARRHDRFQTGRRRIPLPAVMDAYRIASPGTPSWTSPLPNAGSAGKR